MAEERVIKIVGDTKDANKKVNSVTDDLKDLDKQSKKTTDTLEKGVEDVGKSAKKTRSSVGGLGKGFKVLGSAIKAAGIGLFISLVAGLGAAFAKNQKIMNVFNTVTETIGIVLGKVTESLVSVYESVSENSKNFDALGKVMGGLLTLVITPFKLAFFGIKLAVKEAQLAWEQSIFGKGDKDTIKQLTLDIIETKDNIVEIGKEAAKSGKDIVNNFGEAIEETSSIAKKTIDEVGKISIKNAISTAKTNVEIRNTAKLAAAQQQLLVERYDTLAEKQRKIRDNEFASIEDRKKASNKLKTILKNQEVAMRKVADAQIMSAKIDLEKNKTVENQVALTESLANKQGVLAQIEGFTTEQKEQNNALLKEEIELNESITNSEKERRLAQLDFEASREKDPLKKLEKEEKRLNLENEIILEDLKRKRLLFKKGTQARADAEQEYLNKKQEIDNKLKENEEKQLEEKNKKTEAEIDLEKKLSKAKQDALDNTIRIAGEESKIGKALLVAKNLLLIKDLALDIKKTIAFSKGAIARSQIAVAEGVSQTAKVGFPQNIPLLIGYAAQTVGIISAIKSATSSVGGGGISSPQQPSAPSFNLVEGTGSNQIAETISSDQKPVQAYVVASNVTSQQELDAQTLENSTI